MTIEKQKELFKKGNPEINLIRAATIEDGIVAIRSYDLDELIAFHKKLSLNGRLIKFTPASGAATRMFSSLNYALNNVKPMNRKKLSNSNTKEAKDVLKFIDSLHKFPFYQDLSYCLKDNNINIDSELSSGNYYKIIDYLLNKKGLNYSKLPKALIKFHRYSGDDSKPAIFEHLNEAMAYCSDINNTARLHFTVPKEYLEGVKNTIDRLMSNFHKTKFDISYSFQGSDTDTICVDLDNKPITDDGNKFVTRPAGHGALINNLNSLNNDIAIIKNIDNVVPFEANQPSMVYKKYLIGFFAKIQQQVFNFLEQLEDEASSSKDNNTTSQNVLHTIEDFIEKILFINPQQIYLSSELSKKETLINFLNRPIRACGVVKNTGEPGGGPFWVKNKYGIDSLQIVESSQFNFANQKPKEIFNSSTHFNPVDMICGLKNYKGEKFDLHEYIDKNAYFISEKTLNGKKIKALELPGLWNGAMENWITLFVEIPIETFNPVKTVFDLLKV